MTDDERSARGIVALGGELAPALDRLDGSYRLRGILGVPLLEAVTAVRRHEAELLATSRPEDLAERLRFVWTC
jgi:glutamine synthetase